MPNGSPPVKARTALQNITDRIRRAFGSAGEITPSLFDQIQLSAQVANLQEPGNSPYRGRFFAAAISVQNAAIGSTSWALRNNDPVVVTQIIYSAAGGAGDTFNVFQLDPGTAPTNVPATAAGTWTDQKSIAADRPPLLDNNNLWVADAAAYGVAARVFSLNGAASGTGVIIPVTIHLVAGSTLVFQNNLGATKAIGISVFGKIF